MSATTFINTKAEAKTAVKIAHAHGFTSLTVDNLYKRYTSNVFSAWSTDSDARKAQAEIRTAIVAQRKRK